MSTPTLTRAAELLECEAAILRESCTDADGEWSDKCELLRTAHDEMLAVAAELRAMIADAPQPPASVSQWPAWQPIETAPKDGTALLLWEEASIHPFVGWWAMGGWKVSHEHVDAEGGWDGAVVVDRLQLPITHWMPLPPDPGEAVQPADVAQTVAWARIHPDGSLAGDLLLDAAIEDVRKRSGAWVPLTRGAPADVARLVEEARATYASPESRLRAIVVLTEQRDSLRRTLELIEHATSPDHDDGGHHEAAWELARAALAAKGGDHA